MACINNWSELLPEMLEIIAGKCLSMNLKDFAMFSCVCWSWNKAAAVAKSTTVLQPQMPWFLLSNDDGDERNLYDMGNSNSYSLSLPELRNRKCFGTGSEWILTVGLDREIQLFNPLARVLLPLPSYQTFLHDLEDYLDDEDEAINSERLRDMYIQRAFVLPPRDGRCEKEKEVSKSKLLVVVIYGTGEFVAVATPGDSKWTAPFDDENNCVMDVAYCPTLGLTLIVQGSGFVSYCDLHQLLDKTTSIPLRLVDYAAPSTEMSRYANPKKARSGTEKCYLLESFGDILMVIRISNERTIEVDGFEVYKLDLQTKKWKEVLDLGDVALFVGNSPATSVKASSFPTSCNPNSIYFIDDDREASPWGPVVNQFGKITDFIPGGADMGVFDFADGTIEPFYHGDDYISRYSVPIWLMPKL